MKLPKKELNRYHYALQESIRSRKEWITYYTIRIRWKKLRQKVSYHMIVNYFSTTICKFFFDFFVVAHFLQKSKILLSRSGVESTLL